MTKYDKNLTASETMSVRASMLDDGALHLILMTDKYKTWMEFLRDDGPKIATWAVAEGIRAGYHIDQSVIDFYKSKAEVKDVEYDVQRSDGVKLVDDRPIN